MVLTLARDYFTNPEDAEDAVQEVYIKLLAVASRAPDSPDDLAPWVYRVAENTLKDLKRKDRFRRRTDERSQFHADDVIDYEDPLAVMLKEEAASRFLSNYGKLPHHLMLVFMARYHEGLSYEDIAERFGIAVGTVASRIARAKEMCYATD
jgi:RNA polymerase sigma-70 factor (ECF subfamily)